MVTALLVTSALIAGLASAGSDDDSTATTAAAKKNLVETAVSAGRFDTLASLLTKAGLADTLATGGTFTVFAPTDAAFKRVPKSTLTALANDPEQLKAVLLYHVAEGKVPARKVVKKSRIKTLNGASVKVKVRKSGVKVNNAKVTRTDVKASNGIIHVINRVLIPKG
jgi:uncharacterized surface protein with fasciclin (FAS1) repeats